jgi:hypothetical protein
VPGVAKTLVVKAVAAALHLDFHRVQFTPDLMPSDVIGQTIFSLVRTPILRIAVALMSAVSAALAGYYATFGLSGLTITSVPWRQVFAVIGAVVIGVTAWARLAASPPGGSGAPGRPAMS